MTSKIFLSTLILVSLVIGMPKSANAQAAPSSSNPNPPDVSRVQEFPSLWQEDPRGRFPGDGSAYCVPVAASNGLMWLADHGYPKIAADPSAPRTNAAQYTAAQILLVTAITTTPYATMIANHGASTHWVSMGIKKYITDRGYAVASLDDLTVEPLAKPAAADAAEANKRSISLDALKAAFHDGAVIWLMIGRYHPSPGVPDTYTRTSGHALTLVGYGMNEYGQSDPNILIVHDPAKHSGQFWPNSFCHLAAMDHGHWPEKGASIGQPGKSMAGVRYQIDSQRLSNDGEVTLLEDAAILKMAPAQKH